MNKKIIIAIFFTFIMVSGAGLVLFQNDNSHISVPQNPNVINSTTTNQCNVTVGATNSGLTVPLSNVGYSGSNGSSITTSSFDGDATIGNDGSVYGIGGTNNDLLIVNQTVTISNYFIPYGIDISNANAVLTLNNDILDETYGHVGYNDGETGTNLIIENSKIHGGGHPYEEPICVANLTNTLTYAQVDINIIHASNDTFSYNTTIGEGDITTSHFSYNNMTADSYLTVHDSTITDSYLQGVNGSLNGDTIQHSTISFMPSYVKSDAFGNGQLGEQNTNLSYDRFIQYSGSQWDGLMLFDYSNMYNDYANFTVPESDWSNTTVIDNAQSVQGYGASSSDLYRGSTNLNDTSYPVHISHNEFAGWDGMELYGTGNAYIENNIITEQFFWTAYIDAFNQYNEPLEHSILSNNTFYFYGNSAIEDNIDSIIGQGGGNTYITSGESGNLLSNVSIIYNTFQGVLGTVTENTNQHASFILGAYQYVNHNYFDVTSTFNSGASINAPEMELDEFQTSGTSNVSYNKFYGLSSDAVAIAFIPVSSATTYGTEVLYANEYSGSSSPYQVTAYTNYTIDAINKTNYQHLKLNGTVSMVSGDSPSGYTADSYLALIEYNVTFKSNIPYNYTWGVSATGKNQSANVTTSTDIDTLYLAPENYTYTAYVSTPPSGTGIINPYINDINGNITDLNSNIIIYVNFTINTNVLKEHSLMVPIKLYNNGTSAIGEDTIFSINVDWEKYYPFVVGNVSDIRFYDQNDVYDVYEMSAWIQSGQSNLDNTSTVWINLGSNSISAGSSLTIYMNINITKDYFDSYWNTHGSTSTTTVSYQIETLDVSEIQFDETGLTAGTNWTVNLTNNIVTENATSITFLVNEGNYTYAVNTTNNGFYKINPRNGTVFVNEFSTSYVNITFTNISYPVVFKESGLISGVSWTVWLNNTTSQRYLSGTGSEHVFYAINGSYAYSVEIPTYEGVTDFKVSPTSGTIDIVGNNTYDYNIAFTYSAYSVTFKQSGLSSGTWTVNIDNFTYTQSYSNNIVFWGNANQTYNATAKSSNPELVSQLSVYTVNLTSDQTVNVNFIITVTIVESGYTGTWHAIVNGVTYSTTTNTIVTKIAEGYTTITIYATDKYTVNPASMTYNYINKPTTLNVTITPTPTNYVTAIFGNLTMIYIIVFFGIMIAGAVIVYKIKRR